MAVTLNKANLVLKDANGNIGKIEQLSNRDLAKIKTAVSDVALVVNQSNHKPIAATTTNKGVVQLATSADVSSGAIDKVVTAEQLHNATTGTSALATKNLARIDAVVTAAGIAVDHNNTNQLKTAITTLISKTIAPVTGEIKWFAFNKVPDGYLVCNGANVSRTTYADLFAIIGTKFGSGNGSTTFALPNLIDKFAQGSTTVGTVKSAGLPDITGDIDTRITSFKVNPPLGAFSGSNLIFKDKSNFHYFESDTTTNVYGLRFQALKSNSIYGNSTTVQPPALTLLPCIKY